MIDSRAELATIWAEDLRLQGLPGGWRQRYRLTRRVAYYQRLLRASEYWASRSDPIATVAGAILRTRVILLGERLGISISRGTFGPGLSIAHGGSIVINDLATVGARCRLHQGVTIGSAPDGAPRLGDDVFLGPNAIVIGNVEIGDGALIYAGAVVTKDVEARTAVAGVPAKVVATDAPPWHETFKLRGGDH